MRRWNLCRTIVKHFWQRWSAEYLVTLQKLNKWQRPSRNFVVGDVVVLREDTLVPARWPFARVVKTYKGGDGLVPEDCNRNLQASSEQTGTIASQ
jgi:hypothetical protein